MQWSTIQCSKVKGTIQITIQCSRVYWYGGENLLALIARPQGVQGRAVRVKTGHRIFDRTLTNILAGSERFESG